MALSNREIALVGAAGILLILAITLVVFQSPNTDQINQTTSITPNQNLTPVKNQQIQTPPAEGGHETQTNQNNNLPPLTTASGTIVIDQSKRYQTIIGFGDSLFTRFDEPHMLYLSGRGPPKDTVPAKDKEEIMNYIYSDLGLDTVTIQVRKYLSPSYDGWKTWEPVNDNSRSQDIDWSKLNFDRTYWDGLMSLVQNARSKISARGAKPIFIVRGSWGVEDWMAASGNRNQIKPGFEDEYAEWLVEGILYIKNIYNIEADYVTVANEPDGAGSMDGQTMVNVIKYLGPLLEKYNLSTKIGAPETFLPSQAPGYLKQILSDPIASKYVRLVPFHIYDRDFYAGVEGSTNSRKEIVSLSKQLGAQTLVGEVSLDPCCKKNLDTLYKDKYSGGLAFANDFYNELTVSDVSGIDMQLPFWTSKDPSAYVLLNFDSNYNYINYSLSRYYYPIRQFIKYVKQDMVRVDAQSADSQVLVTSFVNDKTSEIVSVLINNAQTSKQVSLSFASGTPATLSGTRSSQNENGVSLAAISSNNGKFVLTLPPQSVSTYIGIKNT